MSDEIENVSFIFPKGSLEDEWREEALRHREEIKKLNLIIKYLKKHHREHQEYEDNLLIEQLENSNIEWLEQATEGEANV